MKKKKKYDLELDDEMIDFEMIGLCTHHSDYRLVWSINGHTFLRLEKCHDDYIMRNKKGEPDSLHPMYMYIDEDYRTDFYLVKNQSNGKYLIPEKPSIDYFLFILNNFGLETEDLITDLREVPSVIGVYPFDPMEIDSSMKIEFN